LRNAGEFFFKLLWFFDWLIRFKLYFVSFKKYLFVRKKPGVYTT
jgi:hypothetical protein